MSFAVEKSVFTSWRTSFALARLTPHVPAPSPPMRPNPSSSIAEAPMKEYRLALEKIEPAPWKPNVPYIVSALESMKAADENAAEKKKSFAKASNVPCTPSVLSGPFFMLPAKMRMMKATSKKSEATSKSTRASHKVSNARKSGGQVGQVNTGSSQPASVAKNARQATVSLPIGYPGSGGQVNTGSSQPAAAASNTIKNAAKITKAIPKKRKRRPSAAKKPAKKPDRGVPFEEMQRLMEVYGSTKCLRKRQPPSGDDATKMDSVKRKFYRWFPDLEERFVKDDRGRWRPKRGHDFELRYREELRKRDGESLTRKRARRRKRGPKGRPAPARAAGAPARSSAEATASHRAGRATGAPSPLPFGPKAASERAPVAPVSPPAELSSPPDTPCVLDEKSISSQVRGKLGTAAEIDLCGDSLFEPLPAGASGAARADAGKGDGSSQGRRVSAVAAELDLCDASLFEPLPVEGEESPVTASAFEPAPVETDDESATPKTGYSHGRRTSTTDISALLDEGSGSLGDNDGEVNAMVVEEDGEIRLDFNHGLGSDPLVADAAPLEGPFLAEGIFGDAEGELKVIWPGSSGF